MEGGMRVVSNLDDLKESFDRASSEAKASFDSPDLYVEEYLKDYRHIEFQILGDGTGAVCHFMRGSVLFKDGIKSL